ncbi:MAG: DUF4226 domain-containing protein [Mycobacteriaceae bacterium]|nr:DUF4226 domain-containing protein [Mycobacteriaceae bacterium]
MAEQAGAIPAGFQARRAALSKQHATALDADRILARALADAHTMRVDSLSRLDGISAEIDRAVTDQAAFALDTVWGAREFQRFLVAKQREIFAVVSSAHEFDCTKKLALQGLRSCYVAPSIK